MIDRERAYSAFDDRHPSAPWVHTHTIAGRMASLRRAVWRVLVDSADEAMHVALSPTQLAAAIATASGRRPANRANVQASLRRLQETGLLKIIDHGNGQRCNTYQLCVPKPRGPTRPQKPAQDQRLQAFDIRAKAWSTQRRRTWRAVWQAILAAADSEGQFVGDVADLADAASDRLGIDIADETVAKILRWGVATQLTDQARGGRIPLYRVRTQPAVSSGR
ncbi:hypothetical protein EV384_5002 [Micromonospora kangleipakensis]|uniref:Helix-turn-helix protein n=1 Tax=Micromonospora kangleipakensis TaxID=1077942 RepID=A0A4Q8BF53_9ACTN|nr:hypothetical protein [Micromonospora kangleipakensis]RZU76358.1 hypothetical protein EV384_5002 [Micromonospora kangleipakensis]